MKCVRQDPTVKFESLFKLVKNKVSLCFAAFRLVQQKKMCLPFHNKDSDSIAFSINECSPGFNDFIDRTQNNFVKPSAKNIIFLTKPCHNTSVSHNDV